MDHPDDLPDWVKKAMPMTWTATSIFGSGEMRTTES